MNRLLRISLDILLTSAIPILGWILLGIILDHNLVNIFTLTYPIQFVMSVLKSVFATGANISYFRDKNKNATNSGIIWGIIVGAFIFGFLLFNVQNYISFMNMEISIYKTFTIYSIIQIYLHFILELILAKLYYKEENKKANKIAFEFIIINFLTLILPAMITKNQELTTLISIISLLIFTTKIVIQNVEKISFKINIFNCIKYDSLEFFSKINFIIIYLFGFSNSFQFGENYMLAISFGTLVTDIQWDIASAICVAAKIDISKQKFNYKEHRKNAYYLITILTFSIVIMTFCLHNQYNVDMKIASIIIINQIIDLLLYPLYALKGCYLQLEYSAIKTTLNKQVANILRTFMSFIYTPYCTLLGQNVSMIYQLCYTKVLWNKTKKISNLNH